MKSHRRVVQMLFLSITGNAQVIVRKMVFSGLLEIVGIIIAHSIAQGGLVFHICHYLVTITWQQETWLVQWHIASFGMCQM